MMREFNQDEEEREHRTIEEEEVGYEMSNLKPGERFLLELRSMTGNQTCVEEKVPRKLILTKPLPPSLETVKVESTPHDLTISWSAPEADGHTFMEGYRIQLKNVDGTVLREFTVSKHTRSLNISDQIMNSTQYIVSLASFCRDLGETLLEQDLMRLDYLESFSNCVEKIVITPPLPPTNLKLETSASTSLKIK